MPRHNIRNFFRGGAAPGGAAPGGAPGGTSNAAQKALKMAKDPKILIIGVIGLIILIIIIVSIVKSAKNKKNIKLLISDPQSGSKPNMISYKDLPTSTSHEYSINFWIFCRDWTYNYGKPKCVLYKGDPNCNHVSPMVFLYPETNNLMVRFSTQATSSRSMNPFKCSQHDLFNPLHSCDVTNIPIQRWVQVTIVLWNTTTDVYINGKLARSCTYNSIPLMMSEGNIYIAQGGGFNGYISKLSYYNHAIDALTAYKLYMNGPVPKKVLGIKTGKINLCNSSSSSNDPNDPNSSNSQTTNTQPNSDAFIQSEDSSCPNPHS